MRILFYIFFLLLMSCSTTRTFEYVDAPDLNSSETIIEKVSPADFSVYTREVCVSDQKAKEAYTNCPDDKDRGGQKKLEVEYLLISDKTDRVVYITNFPDKYEYIYNSPGFDFKDGVRVNVWYFSKIFIGKIDRANGKITFEKNDKKSRVIQFRESTPAQINFTSIAEVKNDKSHIRQMSALGPPPSFTKRLKFEWIFNEYLVADKQEAKQVPIANDAIVVVKRDGIYFELAAQWQSKKQNWIKYKKEHLATHKF